MVLLIMAAGSGTRYGKLKQFDELGPNGEFLMEFSIYDAIKHKIEISTELLILFFVIFNFLLIVLLYISYWQDIEVASSYRYIVVCYNLIFVSTGIQLSKIENIKS